MTVYNALYKFVTTQPDGLCQISLFVSICAAREPTHNNCLGHLSGTWTPLM